MRRLTLTLIAAQMVTMSACMTDNFDPTFPSPDASAPLSDAYPMDRGVPDTSLNPDAMTGPDSTTPRDAEADADSTLTADADPPVDATVSMDVSPLQDAALLVDATPNRDSRPLIDADLEVDTGQQPQDSGVAFVDSQPPARDMEVEDNPCNDAIPGSRCLIAGVCVDAGQPRMGNPCEVCLPHVNLFGWTEDQDSPVCAQRPYWADIEHAVGRTPHGRAVGLVCHNCYAQPGPRSDNEANEAATRNLIRNAQLQGADLIELDLKEEGGVIYIDHEDDDGTRGSRFDVILDYDDLREGTQPLYIELKEGNPTPAFIERLLRDLQRFGYGVEGRPVFLRAFYSRRENLLIARRLLAAPEFADLRPHLRLNVLFSRNNPAEVDAAHARLLALRNLGMHGVEFYYDDRNLLSKIAYARSLGLGVTLFTIPVRMGEVFIANSRDLVDALVLDYPLDAGRAVVEDDNALVNLDVSSQTGRNRQFVYQRSDAQNRNLALGGADGPTVEILGPGEDRFGASLIFESENRQSLTLYDADTRAGHGYFVSALVNFDELDLPNGATRSIVAKSDAGGFALELYNPDGIGRTVLRFGVRIQDRYVYATYPASRLNGTDAFWITGAYDGDGAVRMWVNNSDANVDASDSVNGGVVNNNSPIVIGADPQGPIERRFHISAKIQRVNIQSWRNH